MCCLAQVSVKRPQRAGLPADVVPVLSAALALASTGPLLGIGNALATFETGSAWLGRLQLASEIRQLAAHGDPELLDRLAALDAEPWRALSHAVALDRKELAVAGFQRLR